MKPACEDETAIFSRPQELERERQAMLSRACEHEWGAMDLCKNCGVPRPPDANDGCYD